MVDVRAKRQASETNPWKGTKLRLKGQNDTLEGFDELEASENNVEELHCNPPTEDRAREINSCTSENPRPTFINFKLMKRSFLSKLPFCMNT